MKTVLSDIKVLLVLSVASLILILLDSMAVLNRPKSVLQTITIPIQYGIYHTSQSTLSQFKFIFLARYAALENKALKEQLGEILVENANLRQKLAETESLVDQQNLLSFKTFDLLPARPLGIGRFLLVDKGQDDGVVVGQAVIFKNHYLGQVKSVSSKTAEVLLAKDPDSKIAVSSQGREGRAKGLLQGRFGAQMLLDKILHEEQIAVGDLVYSEGTEGRLPRGLVMGQVTLVDKRQNEVFKRAEVKPLIEVADLDLVFVVRSP